MQEFSKKKHLFLPSPSNFMQMLSYFALVFCFTVAITNGFSIATGLVHHGESSKLNLAMAAMNVKPKNDDGLTSIEKCNNCGSNEENI